jgi:transcription initiation factor IIE alpha subunit
MKRIVRLTESDLARIVKRVIREQEEETDSVEMEIEDTDENDAKGLERIIDKLGDGIQKMKRNNKFMKMLRKHSMRSPKIKRALMDCEKYN